MPDAAKMRYVVLDVGQGTGQFIELYDSDDKLINTVLIDLGSLGLKDDAGINSANYVANKLNEMDNPKLDYVFVSHSDSDHHNLIPDLLNQFVPYDEPPTPQKKALEIDKIHFGGPRLAYTKYKKNVLDALEKYSPNTAFGPPSKYTSYRKNDTPVPICNIAGLELYYLIANTPKGTYEAATYHPKSWNGYVINTFSLVVVASYRDAQYIATGDATGASMAYCNMVMAIDGVKSYLPSVIMLSIPHHGSATTSFDISRSLSKEIDKTAVENVQLFAENLKAVSITASAAQDTGYKHPSATLLKLFWSHVGQRTAPTYYTAFFKPEDKFKYSDSSSGVIVSEDWPPGGGSDGWWYSVQTNKHVYTNWYFYQPMIAFPDENKTVVLPENDSPLVDTPDKGNYPDAGVHWVYTSPANDGSPVSIHSETNLKVLNPTRYTTVETYVRDMQARMARKRSKRSRDDDGPDKKKARP